jgi:PAS domain S-box-containing protein
MANWGPSFKQLRALRHHRVLGTCIAVAAVLVAAALHWSLRDLLHPGSFGAFYLAIMLGTFCGGTAAGVLATILSGLLASVLFATSEVGGLAGAVASQLAFFIVAAADVALITVANVAVDRLCEQRDNVRRAVESAPVGVLAISTEGVITLVNSAAAKMFGHSREQLLGKKLELLVPEASRAAHESLRTGFLHNPQTRTMGRGRELKGYRRDGTEFPVEIGLNPIEIAGRRGVVATITDVTERKRAQERQDLLTRELHHRTHNLFAVVQAVVNRSLTADGVLAGPKQRLLDRLQALAHSYLVLTEAEGQGVPLAAIVKRELAGFEARSDFGGNDVVLASTSAQNFALIVHELATNASKHGALSVSEGKIQVRWRAERANGHAVLKFTWQERHGPTVALPQRRGFGHIILEDLARRFSSTVILDFAETGFRYELQARLDELQPAPTNRAETT